MKKTRSTVICRLSTFGIPMGLLAALCFSGCADNSHSEKQESSDTSIFSPSDSSYADADVQEISFYKTISTDTVDFLLEEKSLMEEVMPEHPENFDRYLSDNSTEKYLVFHATVTNISRDAISLDALKSKISLDGYNYIGTTFVDGNTGISDFIYSINPLTEQEIMLIFSVPDSIAYEKGQLYIGLNDNMAGYCLDDLEDMDHVYTVPFQF